jgi:flagellar basal-body rod protein FlgG
MRSLSIAATGMSAQALNVEVIANNIANINTTGFKRSRAEFTDLLYQIERTFGVANRGTDGAVPEGAQLGLGTRLAAIRGLHQQGPLTNTGNKLDLAINGSGWFQITSPDGETLYTRSGSFNANGNGELVTKDGYLLSPAITIPANTIDVHINQTGHVFAHVGGQNGLQEIGQLTLASFPNSAGLEALGGNLYRETAASGSAVTAAPRDPGLGTVEQGFLEHSNVDPVKEITDLIAAQRGYEMNSKVIQAADDMMGVVSKGIR